VKFLSKIVGLFVASTNHTDAVVTNTAPEISAPAIVAVAPANLPDPLEDDYQKLLATDDAAQEEVDKWIRDNKAFVEKGGGLPDEELNRRIRERLQPVKQAYDNFIGAHPDHARARTAYGSFLSDTGDEDAAAVQWEKSRALDPSIPATWNNLGNYYSEHASVTNAFACYAKAMELKPDEPLYYHNLGTTVYVFRKDAMEYFHLASAEVLDKTLALYNQAFKLDPQDFPLATDIAQTYYSIKPLRTEAALQAWTNALAIARDEIEREGVYVHLARIKLADGRFAAARAHLDGVTNAMYDGLKSRLLKNIESQQTNSLPAELEMKAYRIGTPGALRSPKPTP
jgi:tetratricopeptide (TPR) repeat protein